MGATHRVTLIPEQFHKLDRIETSCEGSMSGENAFVVEATEADKLILKDAGKGKSKTYHLPGAHDAPKINSSNTDTEEADY